ncbi:pentatricopeptide repeat-containing protein At3g26782, mitochondrial-like isoform X1 [Typha angustifolia]|uniref:pentatricopeptide repeat-containing protein At3g26782, mitochondrial-like isoform X1 n=1 Tax=Typha angustifolia TaxID=59011 RepID=UPI003C2F22A3
MASLCCTISSHHYARPDFVRASKSRERLPTSSSEYGVLLQSCIDTRSLEQGRKLHSQIKEAGFERNRDLLPKLVKLYSSCGRIEDARVLFDRMIKRRLDVFVWTSMISAYVKDGDPSEAIKLFVELLRYGKKPDSYTFSALLKASAELGFHRLTMQLHSMIVKCECILCLSVANSLIYAYGSFGDIGAAHKVFDKMELRDIISWSSMIQACTHVKSYAESMLLFYRMQHEECLKPNELTVVSLLPACGFFSSLRRGQAIHAYAIRNGFSENLIVGSSLVTMYSQCGEPDVAYRVFSSLERKNVILWTSMIKGFSLNGKPGLALNLFQIMQRQGLKPNHITFVVILMACSHGGFVDTGLEIFETMQEKFGVKPRVEHYACVVDMLSRAGRLNDAERFIERMSIRPNGSVLGCLLGACQVHRNVELGEKLAYRLFELEPDNAANYVILSNIYASVGRWDDVGRIRQMMAARGLLKEWGCSWIEIMDKVYVFGAHDKSHSESEKIYKLLEELGDKTTKAGYVPSTKFVLLDVEDEDKKKMLCSHSERLAIAFGLLKAPLGVPIRIAKNLRVCGDCHDAIKLISKVTSRQFIIRDTSRFHHFSQGACSCGDYW